MQLNLPILDQLKDCQNILVAGAGGGFDVYAGLPIYFTLREMGKTVHLANYSFSSLEIASTYCDTKTLRYGLLAGAQNKVKLHLPYYPEGFLAQWFKETQGEDVTVWMFAKVGPQVLMKLYAELVEYLNIDALILVDGGVDSLTRGDEAGAGTFLEDSICLSAVDMLDIPVKILVCVGFGAELEVSHYNALNNMAELIKQGAFLGSCALAPQMNAYQLYKSACRYVWDQPGHACSQINMRIVSAVNGEFGDFHIYHDYRPEPVFVSALMGLYWFFDAHTVIERSWVIPAIRETSTIEEAHQASINLRLKLQSQARQHVPIPY